MTDTTQPGRTCPVHYRYRPADLCTNATTLSEDVLYVIGGLYGNPAALDTILAMAAAEQSEGRLVRLIFNGDFNWFNSAPEAFKSLNRQVLKHDAIQGNVELELASAHSGSGCGCAYPSYIDDAVVARSNRIMARLQANTVSEPDICNRLDSLPRWRCYRMAGETIVVLHGDPQSLAGWGLAHENLARADHQAQLRQWFAASGATVFASTHTCLPALWHRRTELGLQTIINNGSAGMGNLLGDYRGLITRIATTAPADSLGEIRQGRLHIGLIPVAFDLNHWLGTFDRWWPEQSPAALSYRNRLLKGTNLRPDQISL